MFGPLTERKEWKFFATLPKASPGLAAAWWTSLILRGTLPAVFAMRYSPQPPRKQPSG